jgi:hypothetical protein
MESAIGIDSRATQAWRFAERVCLTASMTTPRIRSSVVVACCHRLFQEKRVECFTSRNSSDAVSNYGFLVTTGDGGGAAGRIFGA